MGEPNPEHTEVPTNENPLLLTTAFSLGVEIVQKYGWFILVAVVVAVYLQKKFGSTLSRWRESREQENLKKYDVDPSVATGRLEAMERARQRMQEQFNSQAELYAEKQKRREEEKRQEKIENWDRYVEGKGSKSKYKPDPAAVWAIFRSNQWSTTGSTKAVKEEASVSTQPKPKKPLRPDGYNPLMGDSSRYRPSRASRSGGG